MLQLTLSDFPGRMLRRSVIAPLAAFASASVCASQPFDSGGYHLETSYMGEVWHAASGGLTTGSSYLDNLDIKLTIDGEQALNKPGLTIFAHALYNNGGTISEHLVGDAQGVSGIETVKAVRLFQLWGDWAFGFDANHSVLFGLFDLNSEFDAIPSAGLFVGASHGMGPEFSNTGRQGPSTFPVSSLTLRYRWQMNQNWSLQAALVDGVPGHPDHPDRNSIHLSNVDGALLTSEVAYEQIGMSKFAFGVWHYTASFDVLLPAIGVDIPISRRNNQGAYIFADIPLLESPGLAVDSAKVSAFLRYGFANAALNRFDRYLGAGLVVRGTLSQDWKDELGLAVSHVRNGKDYRRLLALAGTDTDSHETIIELSWRLSANDWLSFQPNVQYVLNPNTDPQLSNAFVMGLRFEMAFENIW